MRGSPMSGSGRGEMGVVGDGTLLLSPPSLPAPTMPSHSAWTSLN